MDGMRVLRAAPAMGAVGVLALVGCTILSGVDRLTADGDGEVGLPDGGRAGADGGAAAEDGGARDDAAIADGGGGGGGDAGPCDEPGLVAFWHLDEGAGDTVTDCTSRALVGTIEAGAWVAGKHGMALSFDGGFVGLGSPPELSGTGALTVMAWIREEKSDSGLTQYIVGKTASAGVRGWRLGTEPPALTMSTSGEGGAETTGGTVPNGAWVHVAAVYHPGTAVELYVDGARIVRNTGSTSAAMIATADELRIGTRSDGKYPFIGAIDEVRIYDRALSEAEIAARALP